MNKMLLSFAVIAAAALQSPRSHSQVGGGFDLTWNTIDSGGVLRSVGGDFELSGTIGQLDAGQMTGGNFALSGGFWFEIAPGDCTEDGATNLVDYLQFTECFSGPLVGGIGPICLACFDMDADDDVDLVDFAAFQVGVNAQ